jgi:(2R)-sulfolactate sulfo-lyase subunit alpha
MGGKMIHLLVHDKQDTVGVAVIEGIIAGQEMTGWVMEDDSTITVTAKSDIPIGHKAAIRDIKSGDTIIKYGFDIGKAVADIHVGEHAHVHNIKTKRW